MAHHDRILPLSTDKAYYGAYSPSEDEGPMDYLAVMLVENIQEPPEGLTLCQVSEARWAVFECTVEIIGQTSNAILREWLPTAPYD